jgi:hypothetical protein
MGSLHLQPAWQKKSMAEEDWKCVLSEEANG